MARSDIHLGFYSALNTSSMATLLGGSATVNNRRLYAGWPQTQPVISNINGNEGWLVYWEEGTRQAAGDVYERVHLNVAVFTTRARLAEQIVSLIDTTFDWKVSQQEALSLAEYVVVNTRRLSLKDEYEAEIKMHRRTAVYELAVIQDPW